MITQSPVNSSSFVLTANDRAWQQANEARLRENAQRWIYSKETTLYTEKWEGYYVAVTREGQRLVLWMMEDKAASTDWIQSVLDLREPLCLQSSYTQAMTLALLWQPSPRRVFFGGLGGGCLATMLHHHLPHTQFQCVEIAQPVVTAATRFFAFRTDERLSLDIDDVRAFLQRDTTAYDLLLLDIFCDGGRSPAHVMQHDFFALCRRRLAESGLLAVNAGNGDPEFENVSAALADLFSTVFCCRGRGSTTVFFATDRPPPAHSALTDATAVIEKQLGLRFPLLPWTSRLEQLHPAPPPGETDPPAAPPSNGPASSAQ